MKTATPPPAPSMPVDGATNHFDLPTLEFERKFSKEPFLIQHHLCENPLFDLDRILQLAKTLPEECIEYNAGQIPVSIDGSLTPRNGLSPEETIRRIQECKSWMVLKYVENDPEYAALLNACLDEIRPFTDPIAPGMTQPQAFIFITSPGSVTPYHIDPEHNFLLQVRGSKEIHLYDGRDRDILSEQELEEFYCDRGRNLQLRDDQHDQGWMFELHPSQGLHFPVTYPHYVKNGDEVSISFSITFRTPDLDRRRANFQINSALRQRGISPWPVGKSELRDAVCYHSFRVMRKLRSFYGRK